MFALHTVLIAGQESAYDQAHAAIPAELVESLQAVGIRDWMVWRSGRDLFHLVDCDDLDASLTALADDPVNQRWQQQMARFVERTVTDPATPDRVALRPVWNLATQLGGEPEERTP